MQRMMMAILIASQLTLAAPPARAAELLSEGTAFQRGAFAGARLHLPLGDSRDKPRAAIAFAPAARSRDTGSSLVGRGLELRLSERGALRFAAGGRALDAKNKQKAGVSTLGWVAIGVGTVLALGAVAAAVTYDRLTDCDDHDDEC